MLLGILCLLISNFSSLAFLGTVVVRCSGALVNISRFSPADLWIGNHFRNFPYAGGWLHILYRALVVVGDW